MAPPCERGAELSSASEARIRAAAPAPKWGRGWDQSKLTYLRKVDLFDGLSDDDLRRCESRLPMMKLHRGRLFLTPASREQVLFILKEGNVRLYRVSADGRELTLGVLEPGAVFGTLPMFGALSRNTFGEASTDAMVCTMSEMHLSELVRRHPDIALRLLRLVGERLVAAEDQIEDLAFRSAEQRVTRSVLRILDRERESASALSVSHEEIAKSAGVARETVTKILGGFEREGIIETGYRRLRVCDRTALEARTGD